MSTQHSPLSPEETTNKENLVLCLLLHQMGAIAVIGPVGLFLPRVLQRSKNKKTDALSVAKSAFYGWVMIRSLETAYNKET